MVAYVISLNEIRDEAAFEAYGALARRLTPLHGGRVLARGPGVALEGDDEPGRVLVIEFSNAQQATDFYRSTAYAEARRLREGAGQVRLILVDAQ